MTQTTFEKLTFEIAGIYSRRDARLVEEHIEEARKNNQITEEQYKVLSTLWNLKDYEALYISQNPQRLICNRVKKNKNTIQTRGPATSWAQVLTIRDFYSSAFLINFYGKYSANKNIKQLQILLRNFATNNPRIS